MCYNLLERDPSQRYSAQRALNYAYDIRRKIEKEKEEETKKKEKASEEAKVKLEDNQGTFDFVEVNQLCSCVTNGVTALKLN